jgi:hypothetical protein
LVPKNIQDASEPMRFIRSERGKLEAGGNVPAGGLQIFGHPPEPPPARSGSLLGNAVVLVASQDEHLLDPVEECVQKHFLAQ